MAFFGIIGSSWNPSSRIVNPGPVELARIHRRFDNLPFARDVLIPAIAAMGDGACFDVFADRVELVTGPGDVHAYYYADHGLSNLTLKSCWELTFHLVDCQQYGMKWRVSSRRQDPVAGAPSGSTYYYETPGGHLGAGDTYGSIPSGPIIGYRATAITTPPAPKPVRENW